MTKPTIFELQATVGAVPEGGSYTTPITWHAGTQVCVGTEMERLYQDAMQIIERLATQVERDYLTVIGAKKEAENSVFEYETAIERMDKILLFAKQHREDPIRRTRYENS